MDSRELPYDGEKLFKEKCSMCHLIKKELVGPALDSSIKTRSEKWLLQYIKNGEAMVKSGDKVATDLKKKYNQIAHPNFEYLTSKDIKGIINYIKDSSR